MKVTTLAYKNNSFVAEKILEMIDFVQAKLVNGFASSNLVSKKQSFDNITNKFSEAQNVLFPSAGEILPSNPFGNSELINRHITKLGINELD